MTLPTVPDKYQVIFLAIREACIAVANAIARAYGLQELEAKRKHPKIIQ